MKSEAQTRVPHRCLYWGPGGVLIIFIKALGWMQYEFKFQCVNLKLQVDFHLYMLHRAQIGHSGDQ